MLPRNHGKSRHYRALVSQFAKYLLGVDFGSSSDQMSVVILEKDKDGSTLIASETTPFTEVDWAYLLKEHKFPRGLVEHWGLDDSGKLVRLDDADSK